MVNILKKEVDGNSILTDIWLQGNSGQQNEYEKENTRDMPILERGQMLQR